MIKNILILFVLLSFSYAPVAKEALTKTNEENIDEVFDMSKIIRLKYRPVSSLGSRPTTKSDIQKNWLYSASINCVSNCGRSAKTLRLFLESSVLTNENCPLPIFAVIEFLNSDEIEFDSISVNASGRCFIFKGQTYVAPHSFTLFTESNNISIFKSAK